MAKINFTPEDLADFPHLQVLADNEMDLSSGTPYENHQSTPLPDKLKNQMTHWQNMRYKGYLKKPTAATKTSLQTSSAQYALELETWLEGTEEPQTNNNMTQNPPAANQPATPAPAAATAEPVATNPAASTPAAEPTAATPAAATAPAATTDPAAQPPKQGSWADELVD